MRDLIKIFCLILITLIFFAGVGIYGWQVYETQRYYRADKQENLKIHQECMTRIQNRRNNTKQGLTEYIGIVGEIELYKNCVKDIKEIGSLEWYEEIIQK